MKVFIKFCKISIYSQFSTKDKKYIFLFALVKNNSIVFGLEPFHGILFNQTMGLTNFCSSFSSVSYIHPCTAKHNVKVHAIDTNRWIVLDSQIDMFLDAETKVSISWKVISSQLVLANLKKMMSMRYFVWISFTRSTRIIKWVCCWEASSKNKLTLLTEWVPLFYLPPHSDLTWNWL